MEIEVRDLVKFFVVSYYQNFFSCKKFINVKIYKFVMHAIGMGLALKVRSNYQKKC